VLFALVLGTPAAVQAQVLYGSLTGNVTDPTGSAIPGAKVEALNLATGVVKPATTSERGAYLMSDLQTGTYKVTISATSFATVVQDNVRIEGNTVRRMDVELQLAQVSQNVTVDAAALALQTDSSDVNTQIRESQVANLPLGQDRNFQTLLKLVPGSTPPGPSHSKAGNPTGSLASNVNGGSNTVNMTRIDGTSDPNFWELDIIAYVPPAEAIESVNVVTGSYDAEQGTAGGAVVNVAIKSGTNNFHGAAWEYNTNSRLKARNFFYYGANNPKNILNQFGLALGGPIRKNKLFFYADWERYMLRQSLSGFATVAPAPLRTGNFAGTGATIYDPATGNANGTGRMPFANNQIPSPRLSPQALKMVSLIPLPNQPTTSPANDYFGSSSLEFTRDNVDVKINYNPTDNSSVFGRYSVSPTYIFDPQSLGPAGGATFDSGQPGAAPGLTQSAAIGATHSFTPHLLLDANLGFTRQALGAQNVDLDKNYGLDVLGIPGTNGPEHLQGGIPNFGISGWSSLGNPNVSNPFLFRDNEYLAVANLSWMKGEHSLRFGAEYNRYQINHFQAQLRYGVRGGFSFTGGLSALSGGTAPNLYNAWADFLLGMPQAMGKDYQYINPATVRESVWALYARDRWQATRKLTISYGIRYEYFPLATRDHYGSNRYDPDTNLALLGRVGGVPSDTGVNYGHGKIAPRLGIAYRPTPKTVVRAGYGMSINPTYYTYMRDAYPAVISQQFSGANTYSAAGSLATGLPALIGPDLTLGKWALPTNVGTNTYPQTYRRGYIDSYNFTVQRDLGAGINVQAGYVGARTVRAVSYVNVNAGFPGSGSAGLPLFQKWGNANVINLMMPFNGGRYNSIQTQATRRMMGGSIVGVVYTHSRTLDYFDNEYNSLSWAWPAMWDRNKALAGYDRTHNFQFYGVYDLPFGKGQRYVTHGAGKAILGGWKLNGIVSRTSGTMFTVASSGASVNAPGNTQTADQVLPSVKILGGHGPNAPYFDPAAFAPVTAVRFGTSGRNILRGPGVFNIDASLFREFEFKERAKLQFRTEVNGFTNTPSFGNPGATVSNATFTNGVITNFNGYSIISSATGDRQVRFALRLSF
jgi:hypothetical protein